MALTPEEVKAYRQQYGIGASKRATSTAGTPSERIAKLRGGVQTQQDTAPSTETPTEPVASAPVGRFNVEENDSLIEKGAKGLGNLGIKAAEMLGIDKFGKGIGQVLFSLTDDAKDIETAMNEGKITPKEYEDIMTGGVTDKEVIGGALRTGAGVLSAGAGQIFSPAKSVVGSIVKGGVEAGLGGAGFGAVSGLATGLEKDMSATDTAKQVAKESAIGGAAGTAGGVVLGPVAYGAGKWLARRKELAQLLKSGALDDSRMATLKKEVDYATGVPTLKKDPIGTDAVRQGFDPADVALIKTAGSNDKDLMRQMHEVAKSASTNRRSLTRPLDMVGDALLKPVRGISEQLKVDGKQLDTVAEKLVGQPVEMLDDIIVDVDDTLARAGVSIKSEVVGPHSLSEAGKLDFTGSDFEGVGGTEKIMNNVYNRLVTAKDAHDLHRLKRYIDSNVEYGKTTEGLPGQAERLLKTWRRNIDSALDTQFDDYRVANEKVSNLIESLNTFGESIGRKFNLNDPLANVRVGQVTSRLLGNSPNRGEILNAILQMQKTAKGIGVDTPDDILALVRYADMLEDVFGTQATRSFLGLSQRANGANVAGDFAERGVRNTLISKGAGLIREASGINKERAQQVLLDLTKARGSVKPSTIDKMRKANLNTQPGLSIQPSFNAKKVAANMDGEDFVKLERYSQMLDAGEEIPIDFGMEIEDLLGKGGMEVDTLVKKTDTFATREALGKAIHDILGQKELGMKKVPVQSFNKGAVPETVSSDRGLIAEARKYKTVDEFVKGQQHIYHGTPKKFSSFDTSISEGNATWFTADKADITNNTAGAVQGAGEKLNIMERYVKPNIKLATPDMADAKYTDQLISEGYRGVKYPKGEYGDYEWTKLFNPNEDTVTKSQLTDIYNRAHGK